MNPRRQRLPKKFREHLQSVKGKRPRIVIDHILKHGQITTEELTETYGYTHPPRAVQDVKDWGVPIETLAVKDSQGRSIRAYRFGDPSELRAARRGRRSFPKQFKDALVAGHASRCAICLAKYEPRALQVDHRVPYAVAGDPDQLKQAEFMPVCGSCNRAKSFTCESCPNLLGKRLESACQTCYWAYPLQYEHIAMQQIRRVDVVWTGQEVDDHAKLAELATYAEQNLPDFVKDALRRRINGGEHDIEET